MQRFLKKKGSKLGSGTAKKSYYVTRDSKGRIKKWTQVGRSLSADKRSSPAVNTPTKKRQGNQGDYQYKGRKRKPGSKMFRNLFG